MTTIVIYACDDAVKAATARDLLLEQGFTDDNISVEQTDTLVYNAQLFDGGTAESVYSKIVVIGKK